MKRTLVFFTLALSSAAFAQMRGHDLGTMGGMQGGGMQGMQGQGGMQGGGMQGPGGMQMGQPGGALAEGEVRKVDKDAGKLTLRHGAIPSMDMPPMTMVYRVKDAAMLDRVKAGDKVKFSMEKVNGALTVTEIETVK